MEFEKVRDIIVETLGCDAEAVTPNASLAEDLGADSLAAVELVMALEEAAGLSIAEEDAAGPQNGCGHHDLSGCPQKRLMPSPPGSFFPAGRCLFTKGTTHDQSGTV